MNIWGSRGVVEIMWESDSGFRIVNYSGLEREAVGFLKRWMMSGDWVWRIWTRWRTMRRGSLPKDRGLRLRPLCRHPGPHIPANTITGLLLSLLRWSSCLTRPPRAWDGFLKYRWNSSWIIQVELVFKPPTTRWIAQRRLFLHLSASSICSNLQSQRAALRMSANDRNSGCLDQLLLL